MYILAILFLILFLPIKTGAEYSFADNSRLRLFFYLFYFIKIPVFNKQLSFISSEKHKAGRNMKKGGKNKAPLFLLKAINIKSFFLKIDLGTGDAARTALLSGSLKIAAEVFLLSVSSRFSSFASPPYCLVNPSFSQKVFTLSLSCITSFCLGKIIFVCIKEGLKRKIKDIKTVKESRA